MLVTATSPVGVVPSSPQLVDNLADRRACAYRIGEAKARRRLISADAYLFLYKELVNLCGDRSYCWPGLDYLARILETSEGTIKRWMRELEAAHLIRRKPRPGGQTSLTYITAYLAPDPGPESDAAADGATQEAANEPAAADQAAPADPSAPAEQPCSAPSHRAQPIHSPLFFGPELQIIADRYARSEVISHTVKTQELKNPEGYGGGGGMQTAPTSALPPSDPAIVRLLHAEDVHDPRAVAELQHKPLAELQALRGYLDKQPNVRCRPGLFVWLARQDFGAQLLAGRHRHGERHCSRAAPVVPPELISVWQAMQEHLSRTLPPDDFVTWVAPTTLREIDGHDIVIGTPNVFVRQELEGRFLDRIGAALEAVLGHAVAVHLVIEQL